MDRLRKAREERKLSQTEVAEAIGITRQHYGRIETGAQPPSDLLKFALSAFFNDTVENLFGASVSPTNPVTPCPSES